MSIVVAVILTILGYLIKYKKQYGLIAGYNTKSNKEQDKYNIEKVGILFGNVMFIMATFISLGYLTAMVFINSNIEMYTLSIVMTLGLPYLFFTSNSKKYKRKEN